MPRLLIGLLLSLLFGVAPLIAAETPTKKIVLIAGVKSHGPVGNGIHDYPWSVKLLKVMLDQSNITEQVRVEYHLDGWPSDPKTLDDADTIMVISDGRDGDLYAEAPHFGSPEHLAQVQKQIDRGCGFCAFHFSTFAPDQYATQILDWSGGYFDWEENGQKKWYSAIQTHDTAIEIATPAHPLSRGLKPFSMQEEFYFNLRFQAEGATEPANAITPLLTVPALPGREPDGKVVAWAKERPNGGRGFGTTCGHFYENWKVAEFRTLILNALAWTSHINVPAGGVQSRYLTQPEITAALSGVSGTEKARASEPPIRVLLVAGNEAHKWHNWEQTTPVIKAQLELDPRVTVDVSTDIEAALAKDLSGYDVLVQNSYANWHDPKSLSPEAQKSWVDFLQNGGGLVVVHFANGAWNFSLPMAGESDWPEYRKIVRRVWNHNGEGDAKSGHDAFGPYSVAVTSLPHEISAGLKNFGIVDELYYRQDGTEPIEPLITAHSKDTHRDEPLAWTYTYGKGRVFQTLLGHSERTYEAFEACEMLRRATAWTANRNVIAFTADAAPPVPTPAPQPAPAAAPVAPSKPTGKLALADGKFGQALDASQGGAFFAAHAEHRNSTVTVDCWTKLTSKDGFNILVASEPKSSAKHWEMYSYAGSGVFAVFMPGRGGDYQTEVNIADGQWHHVSMIFEPGRLRLEVDGKLALDRPLPAALPPAEAGPIAFGQLVEGTLGCAGLIDEVRFTRGAREFVELPTEAPVLDERQLATTLGVWRFDQLVNGRSPDECKRKLEAFALAPAGTNNRSPETDPGHWGQAELGFDWTEKNSVDGRWQATEIGRWLGSIVALPNGAVRKGLSIRVGEDQSATLCYDTEFCGLRAIWTGGFLKFDPARFGIIASPQPNGTIQLAVPEGPLWFDSKVQFRRMYAHDPRIVLEYEVDGSLVRETPWQESETVYSRLFEVGPAKTRITAKLLLADQGRVTPEQFESRATLVQVEGAIHRRIVLITEGTGDPECALLASHDNGLLTIPAHEKPIRFKLLYSTGFQDDTPTLTQLLPDVKTESLAEWLSPGPARWTEKIVTRGATQFDRLKPYVVDTLTLPFENPYKALLFTTGIDFPVAGPVKDGIDPLNTLYVCTVHGDVWRVSGVDGELRELNWKRFATGLFQPLGLKIQNGGIYVLGRDQITRLHDRDGNGEADDYECFSNRHETSPGGHDYVTSLEADSQGRFYFTHATQGAVRVSADGQTLEVLGTGLRNPNGMGLGPHDELTATPQEGEWTPGTGLFDIQKGDHFGYPGPLPPHKYTTPIVALHDPMQALGIKAPFAWIPRRADNSSGGQVWVPSDRWGMPAGTMLHLSYGQCTMMAVMQEQVSAPDGSVITQGGTVPFPFTFDSGVCRGRFSPHDHQLYVTGLRGWVNSATQDGCIQRVRYTGERPYLPTAVRTYKNGVAITFPGLLLDDVIDQGNYRIERWNYMYSSVYGSQDYKLSNPNEPGHDEVNVKSATRLNKQTVFLETDELVPCCQMTIRFVLHLEKQEAPTRTSIAYTIHRVPDERIPETQIVRGAALGQLSPDQMARLQPGLKQSLEHDRHLDHHVVRLATAPYPPLVPPSPWLTDGPTGIRQAGWLKVPERGVYRFRIVGTADVELRINGNQALEKHHDLPVSDTADIELRSGYNEIAIQHGTPAPSFQNKGVGTQLRVLWSGPDFAEEPLPPTALFHVHDMQLEQGKLKREGRELFETLRCTRCHTAPEGVHAQDAARWAETAAPSLHGVNQRLQAAWMSTHLLAPLASASDPQSDWSAARRSMPQLFDASREEDQAAVADIVAYLTEGAAGTSPAVAVDEVLVARGRTLFEDLGCIACHTLERKALVEGPEVGRRRKSLDHVGSKFLPAALKAFLQAPAAHFPTTRMPDFKLSDEEAGALVALLHKTATRDDAVARPAGNPTRGAMLFQSRGCLACHGNRDGQVVEIARRPALSFRQIGQGCLAESVPTAAPRYALDGQQRKALAKFLEHPGIAAAPESLPERAETLITRLNCVACHTRDSQTSPRAELITEESESGLAPEQLPNLTWTGEKLHEGWTAKLLKGQLPDRTRPWLKARMPAFQTYAETIASGLAAQHGILDRDDSSGLTPIVHGPEIGARLMQKDALDCRQCHALGDQPPTGDAKTLLAPGINFQLTRERMRYDFYQRWVLDPPRYDIGTRMPKLSADGQTTKVKQLLDGQAKPQFDAIWEFLNSQSGRRQ